jgi:hypothetical protein
MASSIGGAAAQGLEAGFGMGMRAIQQREDTEARRRREEVEAEERGLRAADREFERGRAIKQDERAALQDARLARQDERQAGADAVALAEREVAELAAEAKALFEGGYENVDPQRLADFNARSRAAKEKRAEARRSVLGPKVDQRRQAAGERWARIQAGQLSLDDLSDDDLVESIVVQTGRPISDFIAPEGGVSPIQQAKLDLDAGLKANNPELVTRAANVIFAKELKTGVGEESRDGSEITGKTIERLVPHPQDPERFVPIVRVNVRRADGATGSYLAPITENRSADPQDNVKSISLTEAFDRVGQLVTMSEALNGPQLKPRIEKGAQSAGAALDEFMQEAASLGVARPKKKITRERVDLGGSVLERDVDETGAITGERRMPKTAAPSSAGAGGLTAAEREAAAEDRRLADAVKRGDITPEEAREERRARTLTGGKKPGTAKTTEGERKAGTLLTRLRSSTAQLKTALLDDPSAQKPELDAELARNIPLIGGDTLANVFTKATRQRVEAAQLDILDAALTLGTGAAYTREQLMGYRRSYFPQIGDDAKTVEEKRQRLDAVIQAAEVAAGNAEGEVPVFPVGRRAPPPDAPPPQRPGVDLPPATPPRDFRAPGRDAAQDFQGARQVLQMNPAAAAEVRKRLITAGYPQAAVDKALGAR